MSKFHRVLVAVMAMSSFCAFAESSEVVDSCAMHLDAYSARTLAALTHFDGRGWMAEERTTPWLIGTRHITYSPGLFSFPRWLLRQRRFSWKSSLLRGQPDPVTTLISALGPQPSLFFGLQVQHPPRGIWVPSTLELKAAIETFNAGLDEHDQIAVHFYSYPGTRSYRIDSPTYTHFRRNNALPWPEIEDLKTLGEAVSSTFPLILEPLEVIQRLHQQAALIEQFVSRIRPPPGQPQLRESGVLWRALIALVLHAGDLTTLDPMAATPPSEPLTQIETLTQIEPLPTEKPGPVLFLKPWQAIDRQFLERFVMTYTHKTEAQAADFVELYTRGSDPNEGDHQKIRPVAPYSFESISPLDMKQAFELRRQRRQFIRARTTDLMATADLRARVRELFPKR
jgi:hypothetical protein